MKDEKGFIIEVKVHPGSSRRKIIFKSGELHIYTTKKPTQGEANFDVIKLISEYFKVPKNSISLIRGSKSRTKVFNVKGNIQIQSDKLNPIRGL